jgi:hypothetical protein
MATWEGVPVAFAGILAFPHPIVKKGWRESRTVVLPDFQGLSIGVKLSDYIGSVFKANECRFFSKTAHPAMINYRLRHTELWKQTTHSREARDPAEKSMKSRGWDTTQRYCYAFEYIGPKSSDEDSKLFN